jgi:ABC-type nitrate/sulfonate/bicarbonate transport system substrate-binding protein
VNQQGCSKAAALLVKQDKPCYYLQTENNSGIIPIKEKKMRKFKCLAVVFVLFSLIASTALFAAGGSQAAPSAGGKSYSLTFASVAGSVYQFPVYVAREKGWFKDAGLTVNEVNFTNGPVMVEALGKDGWDLGISGIGGQLPGVITYNAVLIAPINTDDGTQHLFVRNNSPILAAGTGKNKADSRIYGDAASWKGKEVLYNPGAVLHYFLIRVLEGFNLTVADIKSTTMDVTTSGPAFRAGTGDVVAMTGSGGVMSMLADKNYTPVAKGPWVDTGLMGVSYGSKNSLANPAKRDAMKVFFKVYYDTIDWMFKSDTNKNQAIDMLVDFSEEMGIAMNRDAAKFYIDIDKFYSKQDALNMMTTKAPGKNYSMLEDRILKVLQFFIDTGSRKPDDAVKFVGHVDPSVLQEVIQGK